MSLMRLSDHSIARGLPVPARQHLSHLPDGVGGNTVRLWGCAMVECGAWLWCGWQTAGSDALKVCDKFGRDSWPSETEGDRRQEKYIDTDRRPRVLRQAQSITAYRLCERLCAPCLLREYWT